MTDKITAGIDFGTSNSLIATAEGENNIKPIPFSNGEAVIPTTLFFGDKQRFGKEAINAYLAGVPGRFMRGIKSLLGSKTETDGTYIDGRFFSFSELIKTFVGYLKKQAEKTTKQDIEDIVMGRPVHFDSDTTEDKAAEKTLEKICHQLGFKNVAFQYEPIAAALHYENDVKGEELTLVADLGGGTSDFSVIRLSPEAHKKTNRESDVLSNDSVHVAGTDLDRELSYNVVMPHFGKNGYQKNGLPIPHSFFSTASTWHEIRKMYAPLYLTECENMLRNVRHPELFGRYVSMVKKEKGHYVLFETEDSKIRLGNKEKSEMDLSEIEDRFYLPISKEEFLKSTKNVREQIVKKAEDTVKASGVKPDAIKNIIFTGGTSLVPPIAHAIQSVCPKAEVKKISTFSAVGSGLALDAYHRFGRQR